MYRDKSPDKDENFNFVSFSLSTSERSMDSINTVNDKQQSDYKKKISHMRRDILY